MISNALGTMPLKNIPLVNMDGFVTGTSLQKIATAVAFGESLEAIGFVAVNNIGISQGLITKAYDLAEAYFNQPESVKLKTHTKDGYFGFTPFGTEHAKYTETMDLKEFFQCTGHHPDHLWPELPDFKETMLELYQQLEATMKACLQATAIFLGYTKPHEQAILSDMLGNGHAVMRILHYPPVDPAKCPPGSVRSAEHEDLGIMTIIPRTTKPGLQVKTKQGSWIDVKVPETAAIINSGDVLSIITNDYIPSTTHRVINPPENDLSHRYSIALFGNLPTDCALHVLNKYKSDHAEKASNKVLSFGEFVTQRYQEIGLKDKQDNGLIQHK